MACLLTVFRLEFPVQQASSDPARLPGEDSMKRNNLQFLIPSLRTGLLPLAIVALALSVLSVSQFTPQTGAQGGQKIATASAAKGSPGSALVYPETRKSDTVDDYFGTKVA